MVEQDPPTTRSISGAYVNFIGTKVQVRSVSFPSSKLSSKAVSATSKS